MDPLEQRVFSWPADANRLLEALLGLPEPGLVEVSLERIIDGAAGPSERNDAIEKAMNLGTMIQEAAKRSARKQATVHNLLAWSLSHDLTVRVFSMLDTRSLCHAAATCLMFSKCATDSMCYANIDLKSVESKVNNSVVFGMIQRAGKNLLDSGILRLLISHRHTRSLEYF